jgi:hypothetical protein
VIVEQRWQDNWLVIGHHGSVRVDLQRFAPGRRAQKQEIRDLPAGTPVVLFASAPGAIRRCRTFASDSGIALEREYLAFPSARSPAFLVEDAPAPVSAFVKRILVSPPRTGVSTPIRVALSVLRTVSPWRSIRAVAPGRVVVGRRT